MDYIPWILRGLQKPGKKKSEIARILGGSPSVATALLKGERGLKVEEVARIAEYLEEPPPPFASSRYVPLVGIVEADPFSGITRLGLPGSRQEIAVPYGAEGSRSAFWVGERGMPGLAKEGWVVFCGERQEPPAANQVGELCRCGLPDGTTVVRFLESSLYQGCYDLSGYSAEPLLAQRVVWAELVLYIATGTGAQALVRPERTPEG